eukprot:7068129-Alexandrium_andersonii.AAC.1
MNEAPLPPNISLRAELIVTNHDGLPTVQAAVSGSSRLGPDPRAGLALQRSGLKTRVPVDW